MNITQHRAVRAALTALVPPVLFAALAVLLPTSAHGFHGEPEVFPAYYDDTVVSLMMGPGGNSANPNQVMGGTSCSGLGPDMAGTSRNADVPVMYTIFTPMATQMSCPGGITGRHDMVLTAVPGTSGYQPAVRVSRCRPGPNFGQADFPFTSAAEVEAGIAAGQLICDPPSPIRLAPVVGRRTRGMAM